jgi:hypothetical protein
MFAVFNKVYLAATQILCHVEDGSFLGYSAVQCRQVHDDQGEPSLDCVVDVVALPSHSL